MVWQRVCVAWAVGDVADLYAGFDGCWGHVACDRDRHQRGWPQLGHERPDRGGVDCGADQQRAADDHGWGTGSARCAVDGGERDVGELACELTYQWEQCDASGNGCSSLGGAATSQTYTPASTDVGSTLRVIVTATNAGGHGSATAPALPWS